MLNLKQNVRKIARRACKWCSDNKQILITCAFMGINISLAHANAISGLPVTDALEKVNGTVSQYIVPAIGTLGLTAVGIGTSMNADNQFVKKGLTFTGGVGIAYSGYELLPAVFGEPTSGCLFMLP